MALDDIMEAQEKMLAASPPKRSEVTHPNASQPGTEEDDLYMNKSGNYVYKSTLLFVTLIYLTSHTSLL